MSLLEPCYSCADFGPMNVEHDGTVHCHAELGALGSFDLILDRPIRSVPWDEVRWHAGLEPCLEDLAAIGVEVRAMRRRRGGGAG